MPSKTAKIVGWILTILTGGLLVVTGLMTMGGGEQVAEGFVKMGFPVSLIKVVAGSKILCGVVYLIPQTSVVGAILATGHMGGAIITHLRVGESPVAQIIFPILIWLGIYLREPRLKALIPCRKKV